MTRILLLRHGQSEWNALGRWQGQADPPLSDLGRKQAMYASERIGAVDAIIASDLQRASDTAFIIGEAIGTGPILTDERLRERDAGEWSGLTRVEIDEAYPGYLAEGRRPASVETDESVLARVHAALADLHARYEGADVLAVAHGGLVYALEHEAGIGFERLPNLAGRWLTHDGSRLRVGDRVQLVDDDLITTVPAQI